jgi:recombination protein RecT
MAMRTVVNKACKPIINSSDDSNLVVKFAKMTQDYQTEAAVEEEITENANSEVIEVEYEVDPGTGEVIDDPTPTTDTEPDGQVALDGVTPPKPSTGKSDKPKQGKDPY